MSALPFWFYVNNGNQVWWKCDQPERPPDAAVLWHFSGCEACSIAVDALVRQHPDDPDVAQLRRWTDSKRSAT